jgi:hypothetical protein
MGAVAVSDRLRQVALLLQARGWSKKGVDMSPGAVTDRLRTVGALGDLCRRLAEIGERLPRA